ncbi:GPI mannosyltransferase 4-like [Diadema antillarum]|uniref:GPI mannosyltransferase 4-like n=1 Tax=Diadema antillarum TaxID=105358 RepID=UPI003A88CD70
MMTGSYKLWGALVLLRFVWCLWPQMGYVDPAEFFEGTNTLAARIFGFDGPPASGYEESKPQTTIFFPYITAGLGFHLLKGLSGLGLVQITAHSLVIAPRVMMAVVSLVSDACLYKTCQILDLDAATCLTVFGSSFVTLVFLTRNMTHVISVSTFALLLLLVIDSRRSQFVRRTDGNAQGKEAPVQNPNHGFWLGVFILEGTFNHPSFFIFALIPLVFWLTGSASQFGVTALHTILSNIVSLLPGVITMATFLLLMDSVFYGSLDAEILFDHQLLLKNLNIDLFNNLTVAPFNFLKLNFFDAAIEIKPKTTHLLFNLPLLFFPLMLSFLSEVYQVYSGQESEDRDSITSSTSRAFLVLSFTTPLLVFSLFPIQDPKLLLPLLIPLVLLYANYVVFPVTGMPNVPWIVWNALFSVVFGCMLQGGVVPALGEIRSMVTAPVGQHPSSYYFVFYHTPPPPQYLLAMQGGMDITGDSAAANLTHRFEILDMGDAGRTTLHQTINKLISDTATPVEAPFKKEVYVFAPASHDVLFCRINIKFTYRFAKAFGPHVSLDSPPHLFPDYSCSAEKHRSYRNMSLRERIPALFSLNMYRVDVVRHVSGQEAVAFQEAQKKARPSFNQ